MRRCLIGLLVFTSVTACSDVPITPSTPRTLSFPRAEVVNGSLDDNINDLIDLFPPSVASDFHHKWDDIKKHYAVWQNDPTKLNELQDAKAKLTQLTKELLDRLNKMNEPPGDETKQGAVSRLILYMNLYVYNGPDYDPPDFIPGADNAIGILDRNKPLTLVTPSGDAGVKFDKGSTNVNRVIVIVENPDPWGPCDGPLTTNHCQYPLFYDIMSFPDDGPLLKIATAAVCHPPEDSDRGPSESAHPFLRLAHKKPTNPSWYTPGSIIPTGEGEDIEILPYQGQSFLVCDDVEYVPPGDFYAENVGALNRGVRSVLRLASRVGKFLLPKSAFAIDQGGGGGFMIFSPFNNVDARPEIGGGD